MEANIATRRESANRLINRLRSSRFVRDTLLLQSGQLILVFTQAIANFFVIRGLGPDALGAYLLVQTVAAFAGILDVTGSTRLTSTQLAHAIGADDREAIRDSLAYFLKINIIYNGPLLALFLIVAPIFAWNAYHDPRVSLWCGWLAVVELTDIPWQMTGIAFQASGQIRKLVSFEAIRTILGAVITVAVILLHQGIPALVLTTIMISVLYAGISVIRYRRLVSRDSRFPTWSALLTRARTVPIGNRFRLGFSIAIDKNLGSLLDKVLLLFIGGLGTVVLGDFSVAYKVVTLPQPLVGGISRNLDVFLPRQAGQTGGRSLRKTFIDSTLVSGALWTILTLGMVVAGPIVILVAFPDYPNAVRYVFPLLLQSIGIGLGIGIGPLLRTLKQLKFSIVSQIVAILAVIPLGTGLIALFGTPGVAWLVGLIELGQVSAMVTVLLWLTRAPKESTVIST